jgi:hypothetical protein
VAGSVPTDPDLFFTEFFPEQYEAYPAFPRETTPGSAAFEVSGVGVWSLGVVDRRLRIDRGVAPDCVLRLAMSPGDFSALFVERATEAIAAQGELPEELRRVFFPLFINDRKKAIAAGGGGSVLILLKDGGTDYRLTITPGQALGTAPKASVRLHLSDFLGLTSGRKKLAILVATGRISVRGDPSQALKLAGLLS